MSSATRCKCLVTEGSHLQQDQANTGASLSSIPGTLVLCLNPRQRWPETRAGRWSEDLFTAEAALGLVKQSLFPYGIIWSPFARAVSKEHAASALPAACLANTATPACRQYLPQARRAEAAQTTCNMAHS